MSQLCVFSEWKAIECLASAGVFEQAVVRHPKQEFDLGLNSSWKKWYVYRISQSCSVPNVCSIFAFKAFLATVVSFEQIQELSALLGICLIWMSMSYLTFPTSSHFFSCSIIHLLDDNILSFLIFKNWIALWWREFINHKQVIITKFVFWLSPTGKKQSLSYC